MLTPYLGSISWYSSLLLHLAGEGELPQACRRDLNRTLLVDNSGREQLLSVPPQGGWSRLKNARSEEEIRSLAISEHGNWRHAHLAAMEACFGRAPYFAHLYPELQSIYADKSLTLMAHNEALHDLIMELLWRDSAAILEMRVSRPKLYTSLYRERKKEITPQASILHPLMELGPEATFFILQPLSI